MVVIRVLYGRFFGGDVVSVGYAIAHPRLNPVGILPPGSRPSDVHFADDIITSISAMTVSRPFRRLHYRDCGCDDIVAFIMAVLSRLWMR